jgi:hypothetical protein
MTITSMFWKLSPTTGLNSPQAIVNSYSAFMYTAPTHLVGIGTVHVPLPCRFLPLSQQALLGFTGNQVLLKIRFKLMSFDWTRKPAFMDIQSPFSMPITWAGHLSSAS